MVKSIQLKDFCSHEDTFIEFTSGVNVITGQSDAGKSNIIYAIQLALFDSVASKFNKMSDMIKWGATVAEIEISLEFAGQEATIERTITKSSSSWRLETPDGIYKGSKEVIPHLLGFLQLSPTTNLPVLWDNAIAINQFGVKDGFENTPTKRKEIFNKVLGVDDYNYVWGKLAGAVSLLKEQQQGKKESVIALEPIASQLDDLATELDMMSDRKTEIEGTLVSKDEELGELKSRLDELEGVKGKIDTLKQEVEQLKNKLAVANNELAAIDIEIESARASGVVVAELEVKVKSLQESQEKLKALEEALNLAYEQLRKYDQLDAQGKSIDAEISVLKDKLARRDVYLDELDRNEGIENEVRSLSSKVDEETRKHAADTVAVNLEITQHEGVIKNLKSGYGVCPTCGSVLNDDYCSLRVSKLEGELESLRLRKAELNNRDSERNKALISMRSKLDNLRAKQGRVRFVRDELSRFDGTEDDIRIKEKLRESIAAQLMYMARPSIQEAKELVDLAKAEVDAFGRIEANLAVAQSSANKLPLLFDKRNKLQEWISSLQENVNAVSLRLSDLEGEFSQELLFDTRNSVTSVSTEIAALNAELHSLEKSIREVSVRYRQAEEAKSSLDKLALDMKADEKKMTRLTSIRGTIREAAGVIAGKLVPIISHEASKMFQKAWEGRKDVSLEWTPDYAINITIDEQEIGYTSGGGMQVLAALAVRLAAMKTIGSIGLLVADEISMGAVDDELKEVVPSMIADVSEYSQVIAIDHGGLFDNVISNKIKVWYRDGKSIIS